MQLICECGLYAGVYGTIHSKMCLFRVKETDAPMRLVYRVISCDGLALALRIRSDGFQLIPNSRRMQYDENVKLSTRQRRIYQP